MGKFFTIAFTLITFVTAKTIAECNATRVFCVNAQGAELGFLYGSSQKSQFGCMVDSTNDGPAFCNNCLSKYPTTHYVRALAEGEVGSWHEIVCIKSGSGRAA